MMANLRPIPPNEVDLEALAQTVREENIRRRGWHTTADIDPLDSAASPLATDEELADKLESRRRTADYRRERAMYRVAQQTGVPVEELMQRPEWEYVGKSRDEMGGTVVPMEARAMMAQQRIDAAAERQRRWQAQMMLSGGRPTGGPNGSKARIDALMQLTPEQQQEVIQSNLTNNRSQYNGDPRLAIAQIEAEARRAEGAAQRESAERIASATRDENQAERNDRRTTEDQRFQLQQSEADRKHAQTMAAMQNQQKLLGEQITAGNTKAAGDTTARLEELKVMLKKAELEAGASRDNAKTMADGRIREAEVTAGVKGDETDVRNKALERSQRMQFMANKGAYDVASGRPNTAEAAQYLRQIAAASDRFQMLPGGGFGLREATAMNDQLSALADLAAAHGVAHQLTDPEYRRKLINDYGYSSGWSGGRGGWFGDFWRPMPESLR